MLATLDLAAVRCFAADLNERLRRCDNGEGIECSTLESSISHYVQLCEELQRGVEQWAHAIFAGEVPHDPAVETLLKHETRLLIARAERVSGRGRTLEGPCYRFDGLDRLCHRIEKLAALMTHWVTPQLAVGPSPRTKIAQERECLINARLAKLRPLPSNWQPTDPEQLAFFRKQVEE